MSPSANVAAEFLEKSSKMIPKSDELMVCGRSLRLYHLRNKALLKHHAILSRNMTTSVSFEFFIHWTQEKHDPLGSR